MIELFSKAREVSHALVAIVGVLMASTGTIVLLINSGGGHTTDIQVGKWLTIIGSAVTLLSKLFDSANDAYRTRYGG